MRPGQNEPFAYYKTLGLERSASDLEIKNAFRKLAREYHPDLNRGNQEAELIFRAVNEAYQVLGDSAKRNDYDVLSAERARQAVHEHANRLAEQGEASRQAARQAEIQRVERDQAERIASRNEALRTAAMEKLHHHTARQQVADAIAARKQKVARPLEISAIALGAVAVVILLAAEFMANDHTLSIARMTYASMFGIAVISGAIAVMLDPTSKLASMLKSAMPPR
ncbi:MAG TPA: J domain-containing protein [Candidatus Binataceae bacterium]|nr:J domain-containing protein [Candidatus Binataceae bacterium]